MATQHQTPNTQALETNPEALTHIEPSGWGKRQYWCLAIECPHCGDLHTHGGGLVDDGSPTLGHRVAHCVYHPAEGYTLVAGPPDMPRPKALKGLAYRKMRAEGDALTAELARVSQAAYLRSVDRLEATLATVGY